MPEWMHLAIARIGALLSGGKLDADFQEELDEHLQLLIDEFRSQGFSEAEARRKAQMKLGGVTATRELHRETRGLPRLESLFQDISYALRSFRREPGYFAIAVLIMGLGIGAASSIFSVVNALILKPLPFPESERLVWIANTGEGGLSSRTLRTGNLADWQELSESFEEIGGYFAFFEFANLTVVNDGQPETLQAANVTGSFLPTLGIQPQLGRNFVDEETAFNGRPAALLTDRYWRNRFNADPEIVGKSLSMNGQSATIVGVLPASFDFASVFRPGMSFDVLTPFAVSPETHNWGNTLEVIGRLKPGIGVAAAQDELDRINEQLKKQQPDRWGIAGRITPLQTQVNGRFKPALLTLAGAVGLLLLIACTNLSNLLLARASSRRKEIAVRSALGAGRLRIARQMLTESVVLAACGSLLGLAFAVGVTRFVSTLSILNIPLLSSVTVDGQVLAFSSVAALCCGLLFGMAPALTLSSTGASKDLKESGRGVSGDKDRAWLRGVLVVAETALACVLLVGAGLLLRSFWSVLSVDPGFQPEQSVAWHIGTQQNVTSAQRQAYLDRLIRSVEAIPGVVAAGATDALPLGTSRSWSVRAKGVVYADGENPTAYPRIVDSRYLDAMGIRLVAGRKISAQDAADTEQIVVVNETMAETLWPNQDALGKILLNGERELVVRGVVADVRHDSLETESGLEMYFPITQTDYQGPMQMVVRSNLPVESLAPAVRQTLAREDPLLPTHSYQSLGEMIDRSLSPRKFTLWLIGAFSISALALASLGIYGVVSYSVNQRTQEIGIRMTLGASPASVRSQVIARTVRLAAVGIAIGAAASFLLSETLQALLYGVSATDPWTFAAMTALLLGVAALAGSIPARRISRTDLASVLRSA
jgi:predicted permease